MSKLAEILESEAAAEIDAIEAEVEARARQIIQEAQDQVEALMSENRRRLEAQNKAAAQQAASAAELLVATARSQARGEMMETVRQKVLAALENIPAQPDYGRILQALAEEALKAAGTAEALVVAPDDQVHFREWVIGKGLELQTDPDLRLGVRVLRPGGRKVENILIERLQRGWDTLAIRVAGLLWEEEATPT